MLLGIGNSKSLCLSYINEQEILDVVYEMSNKTSNDCNGVSMKMIKNCIGETLKPLTAIFNQSFNTGVSPDGMNIAMQFQYSNPAIKIVLFITGIHNFYLNVLKCERKFVIKDLKFLLGNTIL